MKIPKLPRKSPNQYIMAECCGLDEALAERSDQYRSDTLTALRKLEKAMDISSWSDMGEGSPAIAAEIAEIHDVEEVASELAVCARRRILGLCIVAQNVESPVEVQPTTYSGPCGSRSGTSSNGPNVS